VKIIGLAGTNGAGKDTVGHILADKHGYLFLSVTDLLRAELERQEIPVTRENMRALGNRWRRERGPSVLVDEAVVSYEAVKDRHEGLAIASLRNPGEADRVHELGGTVLWVDADQRLRYERIQTNAASRERKGEDLKTFEQFQAEEATEMNKPAGGDEATLDMSAVKTRADVVLVNDKDGLETLPDDLNKLLANR
jgi:dephospho-CoA kinase